MTREGTPELGAAVERLVERGIRRVQVFAWRDLDDPDAGGSEVHADEILARWAAAGLSVTHSTSTVDRAREFERRGYVVRQAYGRHAVLLGNPWRGIRARGTTDAVIDIWNGVPWWSPIWFRGPRVTWLHHVHGPMWNQSFRPLIARAGSFVERSVAPKVYRNTTVVTLAESGRSELVRLGWSPSRVEVVEPGIDARWVPDGTQRSLTPHVVAVGRLAPVKRYEALLEAIRAARSEVPDLTVSIVGDGPDRPALEQWIADHDAGRWASLRGRIGSDELRTEYQRAWLVTSASVAEGWGMVVTEAAACGTPAVVTDVSGHRASVWDGRSGVLVADHGALAAAIVRVVRDPSLHRSLVVGALQRASVLDWDRAAARHATILAAQSCHSGRSAAG